MHPGQQVLTSATVRHCCAKANSSSFFQSLSLYCVGSLSLANRSVSGRSDREWLVGHASTSYSCFLYARGIKSSRRVGLREKPGAFAELALCLGFCIVLFCIGKQESERTKSATRGKGLHFSLAACMLEVRASGCAWEGGRKSPTDRWSSSWARTTCELYEETWSPFPHRCFVEQTRTAPLRRCVLLLLLAFLLALFLSGGRRMGRRALWEVVAVSKTSERGASLSAYPRARRRAKWAEEERANKQPLSDPNSIQLQQRTSRTTARLRTSIWYVPT